MLVRGKQMQPLVLKARVAARSLRFRAFDNISKPAWLVGGLSFAKLKKQGGRQVGRRWKLFVKHVTRRSSGSLHEIITLVTWNHFRHRCATRALRHESATRWSRFIVKRGWKQASAFHRNLSGCCLRVFSVLHPSTWNILLASAAEWKFNAQLGFVSHFPSDQRSFSFLFKPRQFLSVIDFSFASFHV